MRAGYLGEDKANQWSKPEDIIGNIVMSKRMEIIITILKNSPTHPLLEERQRQYVDNLERMRSGNDVAMMS